ncbi:DNA mismatch repair endonuclease MutL [bacterium]|nr:DNA mismatch repair endonuclease MutL [bacterium]MBT6528698.1 DNA mismatch repair endonuclease MutL [bacterium]
MGIIRKLSIHEARKIAAGEVVERPSNVVKELLENSLDAGATKIDIVLKDGGKSLIQVTDNGCAMSPEDARMSIEHHATSKVQSVDQLYSIDTFGFRGEALSSICAVARVTLITKQEQDTSGIQLEIAESRIQSESAVGFPTGTQISVRDLFYTVPARKKFLKKTDTEFRQIVLLFQAAVLANPNVHFTLTSDGTVRYNCPPVPKPINRAAQVWDTKLAQHLLDVQHTVQGHKISVSGIITDHEYSRYDRNSIFFFINKRWVKNYTLAQALVKGYQGVLPDRKYPSAAIFVTIIPEHVDVNIHPRKEDVQLLHPRVVLNGITAAVKETLEQNVSNRIATRPAEQISNTALPQSSYVPATPLTNSIQQPASFARKLATPGAELTLPTKQTITAQQAPITVANLAPFPLAPTQSIAQESNNQATLSTHPVQYIGVFDHTYILVEQEHNLILIDQHAAHERILYERFKTRFQDSPIVGNAFPTIIELSSNAYNTMTKHLAMFKELGIELESFGDNQLVVRAQPVYTKNIDMKELINEAVVIFDTTEDTDSQALFKTITEKLRATMACKAAVKAGDKLCDKQIKELIEQLDKCNNRLTCPHGRPTSWTLKGTEIERFFKRRT